MSSSKELLSIFFAYLVWALIVCLAFLSIPFFRISRSPGIEITAKIKIRFVRISGNIIRDTAERLLGKHPVFLSSTPYSVYVSRKDCELCYPASMRPASTEEASKLLCGIEATFRLKQLRFAAGYGPAQLISVRSISERPEWSK
jgi:hypothetical protein